MLDLLEMHTSTTGLRVEFEQRNLDKKKISTRLEKSKKYYFLQYS